MLIPIRCFTCGKVIANKWEEFEKRCKEKEKNESKESVKEFPNFDPNYKGTILDDLGLTKPCCRRHMLTHVNLIDMI